MAVISAQADRRRPPYTKIKMWLMEHNISQKKIGAAIGKDVSNVNQKLNGTGGDFSLSEARILCRDFGIPREYFFEVPVPKTERSSITN